MRPTWLTRNVLVLGLVSLLNDAASEMIAPLLPLFLTTVLGGAPAMVGLVEGAADAVSSGLKLVSGRLSDRWGRRKPLVVGGYALAAATRPFLAAVTAPWMVLALRVVDRVGKGLRTSPRDALLAGSAPADRRGTVFGFHRAMDHAGAFLGAFAAWLLLEYWTEDLRPIFFVSAAPALVAVAILAVGVKEPPAPAAVAAGPPGPILTPPGRRLAWVLGAVGLAGLGLAADGFLLLAAADAGMATATLPLLWMALHAVKVVASLGAGTAADRFGRRRLIAAGWIVRAAIYGGFAAATGPVAVAGLFVVYGLYHGLTEGAEKALVADLAGASEAGTAFGWYHLVAGLVALPAGLLIGGLWTAWGAPVAFVAGAALSLAGLVPLAVSWRTGPPTAPPPSDAGAARPGG